MDIKKLIENGIDDGVNEKKLLLLLADCINSECTKLESFERIYKEVYGSTLCDTFCIKLVDGMFDRDGKGKRWTLDQTNDIARKLGISFSDNEYTQYEFWAAMHMMYYDYSLSLVESNVTDPIIYGKLADNYLDDMDAPKGKLANYFFFVEKAKELM